MVNPLPQSELLTRIVTAFPSLREPLQNRAEARGAMTVTVLVRSSQLSTVSRALERIDLGFRRADSLLAPDVRLTQSGTVRPAPPAISGLVFSSAEVGSFKVVAALHGRTRSLAQQHPVAVGVLGSVMGAYVVTTLDMAGVGPGNATRTIPVVVVYAPDGSATEVQPPVGATLGAAITPARPIGAETEIVIEIPTAEGNVVVEVHLR